MCKEYISILGPKSDIKISSTVGKGTVFSFNVY